MPSWPIEMPSETVIVPNSRPTPPARTTPSLAAAASRRSDALHGVISFHALAIATWGFSQSSSVRPTARSIARDAARWMPSVTSRERGLMSTGVSEFPVMGRTLIPQADPIAIDQPSSRERVFLSTRSRLDEEQTGQTGVAPSGQQQCRVAQTLPTPIRANSLRQFQRNTPQYCNQRRKPRHIP